MYKDNLYETALEKCKNDEEMWVDCKDYPDYKVSNLGNVLYSKKGVLVKQRATSNGSKVVLLRKDNRSITNTIAQLVAKSFELPNEKNRKNVYHINELDNNRLDNLSYDDKYNILFKKGFFKGKKEYIEMNKKSLYEEALEKCKNDEEMWVDVKDYPNYEVSNLGKCRKKKTGLLIGYKDNTEKTIKVQLRNNDGIIRTTLANIIAKSFEVPNPYKLHYAKSLDGDKFNCRLDNLSWTSNIKKIDEKLIKNDVEYSDKNRIDYELRNAKMSYDNSTEIWKDVKDYERWYEVSNLGNVRKLERDGSTKLLKAKDVTKGARQVGLRKVDKVKTFVICHLVADAFNLPTCENNKTIIYHIDGDINNDALINLTYDKTETEEYIEEQERIKDEQIRLAQEKIEKESHKVELFNYIEDNRDFLLQAREMNKEITTRDIYNKLCEILEVLKNDNR